MSNMKKSEPGDEIIGLFILGVIICGIGFVLAVVAGWLALVAVIVSGLGMLLVSSAVVGFASTKTGNGFNKPQKFNERFQYSHAKGKGKGRGVWR